METKQKKAEYLDRANDLSFASNELKILPIITLKDNVLDPNKPLLFIHPPKTAGTNVANLAKAITIVQETVEVRAVVPKQGGMSPNLFTKGKIGGLKTIIENPNTFDCSTKDIKFISGHMPLPSLENEYNYFHTDGLNYIGIIRDPIERELSSANFDYQRKYVEKDDIEDYILNQAIDNLQTRLIAGEQYMEGECNEQTLEIAKQNILSRFKLVAPSEDVEIVMSLLGNYFKINNIAYARAQVTGIKVVSKENEVLCEALKEKHQYDYSLYQWVREWWKNWKNEHIESIREIKDDSHQYLVLDPYFSQTKKPEFMYLDQIQGFDNNIGLVALQQKLVISDNKQMNNLLLNQPDQDNESTEEALVNERANSFVEVSSIGSLLQQIVRYEPNIRYFFKIAHIELPKFDISTEIRGIADFTATFLKYNNFNLLNYNNLKIIPYQVLESGSYFASLKIYEMFNSNYKGIAPDTLLVFVEKCGPYIATGGMIGLANQSPVISAINGAAVCMQSYHINQEESALASTARLGMDLGLLIYSMQQNIPIMQMVTGVVALDISIKVVYVAGELIFSDLMGIQLNQDEVLM
ncbi:hypothetical protein SZ25_00578 [Candidatus Arcanobacter lacustris]|uniref:Uncharacterized protein n=1 Tax=Candidatus Arcanibacter lacustris TaxID=1607817 RepID=A0A0F5MNI4_9RICK|nr:hypothetical protein SZ25_00578 [Candidatus Arcanobacter lacustris]